MYFDFVAWTTLIRLAARESSPRRRRSLYRKLLLQVPLMALFTAVCFVLDPLLFPSLRRTSVREPVFLVGHARSGTTLAHRLMSADDQRFSAFLYWEMFAPSLLQKTLVRWIARLDRRFLGDALGRRVRAHEARVFGPSQHIHKMGYTLAEEDDFVLTWSCASGYWIVQLPYMDELDFYHVDRRPPASRRRLMNYYRECLRRELCFNGGARVHLSKNPVFPGRMESLIECFPDARFVLLYRNPLETIPSLLKLMKTSWKLRQFSEDRMQRSFAIMVEQSFHSYRYPLEVMARHPGIRHAVVEYRELTASPRETIARIYAELGLPLTPAYDAWLRAESARVREHETTHRYSLAEFGLSARVIHERLGDLFARFDWQNGTETSGEETGEKRS